jgi:UDP-N-acetylglucosamine 2-epimerase (non-hydrolysing)
LRETPREIALLVGTRPEAIKLAPVFRALRARGAVPKLYVSGQHRELLLPLLATLALPIDADLDVMRPDQSLAGLSARLLDALGALFASRPPDWLVVQGDTTSVAMGALAAFYANVRVAHVEAGLRTGIRRNPFPEEINRRLAGCLADLHFAPTQVARGHLLAEGVDPAAIQVVGNTIVDAVFDMRDRVLPGLAADPTLASLLDSPRRLLLVTAHRRESFGEDLLAVAAGLERLAEQYDGTLDVVYPVHPNPNVDGPMRARLSGVPGVHLLPPLPYPSFLRLLLRARLVLTDSGGVQEEAAALGVPVLVARHTSERPEVIESGVGELVGPDAERIFRSASRLLTDDQEHARRARPSTAFGDGHAGERIAEALLAAT